MTFSVAGQQVVVVGGGRSGRAAAELLLSRGARVTVADSRTAELDDARDLRARGIQIEMGPHREALMTSASLIVISPGVPFNQPELAAARRAGVPVIGEIELASRWLEGRIVAITGTKGKSTTTMLTTRMLQRGGLSASAGGNVGVALSSQVASSTAGAVHVVEVSSFQLETIETFRPWIAVMLNLSPDHLDRHASFDEYAQAKARIFSNQTSDDFAVINADDPGTLVLAASARAQRLDFALEPGLRHGVTIEGTNVVERREGVSRTLLPLSAVRLRGRHLLADVLAAAAVGSIAGVPPEAMEDAVRSFEGLEHALELVAVIRGVEFINDSKATNVISAKRAIESFEKGVVPILGGRYKGGSFEDLTGVLQARATGAVVIGEAAERIEQAIGNAVPVVRARTMRDAVQRGFVMAGPSGVVLLAPGCSSFDMFSDYAERGRAFKDAVRVLETEVGSRPES